MEKNIYTLIIAIMLGFFATNAFALEEDSSELEFLEVAQDTDAPKETDESREDNDISTGNRKEPSFTQEIKRRFLEGGVTWMIPVLACLILGIATAIERIIYLSLSNVNKKGFTTGRRGFKHRGF